MARWWCAPTTPARPRSPTALRRWASGCCATAAAQDAATDGRLLSWEQHGTGAVAHIQLAGEPHPRVMRLSVPGRHMALNALAALLAAIEVGAPPDVVLDGLAGFEGVRRRFELVGTADGVRVFDDYAHHPTEVTCDADRRCARSPRNGRPRHRGVPAPLVFAHRGFRSRVRAGAGHRRRGVRARRLRRARATDRRHQRSDRRRTRQRAGDLRAGLLRGRRRGSPTPRSPATSSSRWARAM